MVRLDIFIAIYEVLKLRLENSVIVWLSYQSIKTIRKIERHSVWPFYPADLFNCFNESYWSTDLSLINHGLLEKSPKKKESGIG